MAKDMADIAIETIVEVLGWIFKTLAKIALWILEFIIGLVKQAVNEHKANKNNNGTAATSLSATMVKPMLDLNILADTPEAYIRELVEAKERFTDTTELRERYEDLGGNVLLNPHLSVDDKCRLLVVYNEQIKNFVDNAEDYNVLVAQTIDLALATLDYLYESKSMILADKLASFRKDVENGLHPVSDYFAEVMVYAGAMGTPGIEYTIDKSILNKYALPAWR